VEMGQVQYRWSDGRLRRWVVNRSWTRCKKGTIQRRRIATGCNWVYRYYDPERKLKQITFDIRTHPTEAEVWKTIVKLVRGWTGEQTASGSSDASRFGEEIGSAKAILDLSQALVTVCP
jgi:hypothetical protein